MCLNSFFYNLIFSKNASLQCSAMVMRCLPNTTCLRSTTSTLSKATINERCTRINCSGGKSSSNFFKLIRVVIGGGITNEVYSHIVF